MYGLNETWSGKGLAHGRGSINEDHWASVTWPAYGTGIVSSDSSIEDPCWPHAGCTTHFLFLPVAAILIARSSPPWFIVDRPFLFFIRHNPTGKRLFSSVLVLRTLLEFRKVRGILGKPSLASLNPSPLCQQLQTLGVIDHPP